MTSQKSNVLKQRFFFGKWTFKSLKVQIHTHTHPILMVDAFKWSFSSNSHLLQCYDLVPLILLFLWDSLAAPFWYLRIIASGHLFICRVSERETALEETHRLLQQFPGLGEVYLAYRSWNNCQCPAGCCSSKERLLEDSKGVRELMKQWQVSQAFLLLSLVNSAKESWAFVLVFDMLWTKIVVLCSLIYLGFGARSKKKKREKQKSFLISHNTPVF